MTNLRTTYKQTTTQELIDDLKIKMSLAFEQGYLTNVIDDIDRIETELVSRGFTWEQIEALEKDNSNVSNSQSRGIGSTSTSGTGK